MSQDAQKLGERGDMRRPEGTIEEGNEMLGLGGSTEEDGDEQGPQNVSPENENTVNPTLFPANRRSSAPQYNIPGSNWGQFPPSSSHDASNSSLGLPSAPAHMPMGYLQQQQARTIISILKIDHQLSLVGRKRVMVCPATPITTVR